MNQGKSNIVLFGTRAFKEAVRRRTWTLDGAEVKVVDAYKYLGADVGATRGKWNSTISRLWSEAKLALNIIMHMGGGSSGLRPRTMVYLWNSKCRPKLEYACELWQGEVSKRWEAKLESLQYDLYKATLGLGASPAAVGMRRELCLRTLKSHRQSLKLLYWHKLCTASPDRLLSVIFRNRHAEAALGGAAHSWCKPMAALMSDWGLKDAWDSRTAGSDAESWRDHILTLADQRSTVLDDQEAALRSSLSLYRDSGRPPRRIPVYLDDRSNINGTRLKTRFRLGCAFLMTAVARSLGWPACGGSCLLCRNGSLENTRHFLLECPALAPLRRRLASDLETRLLGAGRAGQALMTAFRGGGVSRLKLMLGFPFAFPARGPDVSTRAHREHCAIALWVMDKTTKNYLAKCWAFRKSVMGDLTIERGRLVRSAPTKDFVHSPVREDRPFYQLRRFWGPWVAKPPPMNPWPRGKGMKRRGFFAVWSGRSIGVFHKWSDVRDNIRGRPDARFKGFSTLLEATSCLKRRLCHDFVDVPVPCLAAVSRGVF